ncbi:MAG: hypothetical protein ACOYXY_08590 [Thermodesulfobacteriota bacterium]
MKALLRVLIALSVILFVSAGSFESVKAAPPVSGLPGFSSLSTFVGYLEKQNLTPPRAPNGEPLNFHTGWMATKKGGVFLNSDGTRVGVEHGKGLREAFPVQGLWSGLSRIYSLAPDLKALFEASILIPSRSKQPEVLPTPHELRSPPEFVGGVTVDKRF